MYVLYQSKIILFRTYLFCVALEGLEIERVNRVGKISHPLDGLPTGDKPDIIKGQNGIKEPLEAFHVVRLREPCSVIKKT